MLDIFGRSPDLATLWYRHNSRSILEIKADALQMTSPLKCVGLNLLDRPLDVGDHHVLLHQARLAPPLMETVALGREENERRS